MKRTRRLHSAKEIKQNRPTYRKKVIGYKTNPKNPRFRKIKIKGKDYEKT